MFCTVEEAVRELQQGKVIIVCDDETRENEGDFVALASHITPETINFMAKEGRGLICLPVHESIANRLHFQPMTDTNSDHHRTAFTVSVDHRSNSTGISAFDRATTVKAVASHESVAEDFTKPGHMFPLIAQEGGVLVRPGHTEAAVDLAILSGTVPAGVICEVMNEDGSMSRVPDLIVIAETFSLKMLSIQALRTYRQTNEALVQPEARIQLPTSVGDFEAIGYKSLLDGKEHLAMIKGEVKNAEDVLVRVHSECLTGDVFGSKRCDCGPQLDASLMAIEKEGGVVLYLRQEGRGIGLLNKLRAYELQEKGYDTVEANEHLGFPADMRSYAEAAQMLNDLGVRSIRLLTNNPQKASELTRFGINVRSLVPLEIPAEKENENYLLTKKQKMGHLLHL
ncbi:bifunctional 3,4-dihydroxy-2-butanone-4-phosphate synthase/GTP cyclohydrolase II [Aureibacillus halotolerans]|uniref:Riboflavin biosynthesis protein RibBA n=1 Tax=Aureibacillus halotolerans TaxID=1508390 RepID=A0A4R6U9S2_9BACI|nr:bifunctional 3,4-dihydroxy-2-butanone-4-phosphate synthase/GTP cyclohydrolase II [Aureibacillus halotolerans]TDQ41589.1 GTP cyclohydrolase II /3,4-dihydroxy-2-butanone 4-phosphate synthase [Aureibacillus halotolerans]